MKQRGDYYEDTALALVRRAGLSLVTRNYRCRCGEIDIIARDGTTLAFIEVRARSCHRYGGALYSVDRRKQRKIIATAHYFLKERRLSDATPCRFDVIAFEPPQSGPSVGVHWIRGAFSG